MSSQKNFAVEVLRLIFMVMICIHHSHFCPMMHHGYIAVDFFFILSGVFLYRTYLRCNAPSLIEYNIKRIARFLPEYIIALLATASINFPLFQVAYRDGKILEITEKFVNNLLMLSGSGIYTGGGINGTLWYVVVLIIAGGIVYGFLRYDRRMSLNILLPLICILYYTYIFNIGNTIERWSADGPFYNPLWRGVSGLSLGVLFWECFNRYGYKIPRTTVNFISTISLIIIISSIFLTDYFDEYILLLVPCMLIGTFRRDSWLCKLFNHSIWAKLGGLTYEMYLLHIATIKICWFLCKRFETPMLVNILILLFFTISGSLLLKWFYNSILRVHFKIGI